MNYGYDNTGCLETDNLIGLDDLIKFTQWSHYIENLGRIRCIYLLVSADDKKNIEKKAIELALKELKKPFLERHDLEDIRNYCFGNSEVLDLVEKRIIKLDIIDTSSKKLLEALV